MLTIEKTKKYLKATDVVLDYACGTGITTVQLADQVKEIHAIDFSQNMIVIASEKVAAEKIDNVRLAVLTITDPELKEKSFDVVLAFNILYFLDDLEAVLHRISHLLRNEILYQHDPVVSQQDWSPFIYEKTQTGCLRSPIKRARTYF